MAVRDRQKTEARLFTPSDLCRLFGVHRNTITRWVEHGQLPAPIRIGRRLRWRRETITKLIQGKEL